MKNPGKKMKALEFIAEKNMPVVALVPFNNFFASK
jgi:hypothetical protein